MPNTMVGKPSLPEKSSVSLSKQSQEFQKRILLIDQTIQQYLSTDGGEPAILYEAAHHLIKAGGKRLRSLITLLCCEAVGGDIARVLPITVAAELLQTASLIHDDIIDCDEIRRGVRTVHEKFGRDIALLAGDLLIAQAFRIIGEEGTPEMIAAMGTGGVRMAEGEAADLFMSPDHDDTFTKEHYLYMIERKTAAFMEEAAKIGAITGNATEAQKRALVEYGGCLGFAFQLRDDILDVEASQQVANKSTLSDLRLKRGNYPLVHALEVCTNKERHKCLAALTKGDYEVVLQIIEKYDAIQFTYKLAQSYVTQAKQALQDFGFQTQALLEQVADFTLVRDY